MFGRVKERFSRLTKIKTLFLVISYIMVAVLLTVLPWYLWMYSGLEARGVTSVRGSSMTPTIHNNDIMYVCPVKYERGDIVVAKCRTSKYLTMDGSALLKRIVGLPGEVVEITAEGVLINGVLLDEPYTQNVTETLQESNDYNTLVLSDNEYFLLGDNRANSFDSRHVGSIHRTDFLYSLTVDPNEQTQKIITSIICVCVLNVILILSSWFAIFMFLTKSPKTEQNKYDYVHKGRRKKIKLD